jgi:hypothetical protein
MGRNEQPAIMPLAINKVTIRNNITTFIRLFWQ